MTFLSTICLTCNPTLCAIQVQPTKKVFQMFLFSFLLGGGSGGFGASRSGSSSGGYGGR